MTECYFQVDDDEPCQCEDCGHVCRGDELVITSDVQERLFPGDLVPAGQCPECGSLSFVMNDDYIRPLITREDARLIAGCLEVGYDGVIEGSDATDGGRLEARFQHLIDTFRGHAESEEVGDGAR